MRKKRSVLTRDHGDTHRECFLVSRLFLLLAPARNAGGLHTYNISQYTSIPSGAKDRTSGWDMPGFVFWIVAEVSLTMEGAGEKERERVKKMRECSGFRFRLTFYVWTFHCRKANVRMQDVRKRWKHLTQMRWSVAIVGWEGF